MAKIRSITKAPPNIRAICGPRSVMMGRMEFFSTCFRIRRNFVSSVTDRDYTMVMGQTIFIAALYILSVLIVDILYGFIDPRIRISQRGGRDGN